ncbi:hypothetical protein SDC9_115252 [bioreactor metagenome]|uniref:Uncharacterized protein n=1 Tax=bioreactor metagenome TaxID=1076179 RepID=A0A645BSB5_9ZZZZ
MGTGIIDGGLCVVRPVQGVVVALRKRFLRKAFCRHKAGGVLVQDLPQNGCCEVAPRIVRGLLPVAVIDAAMLCVHKVFGA